jgi:hypothetical protein
MRRITGALLTPVLLAPVLLVALLGAGCATSRTGTGAPAVQPSSAGGDADLYLAVLRRYLGTPADNSFPDRFATAYVLDRADPNAADPMRAQAPGAGAPIGAADQRRIVAGLRGVATVRFVGAPDDVLDRSAGCARVPDGGILITLGTPVGGPDRVEVGVSGFVACLGATWLTYVVERRDGGWQVTGTTGSRAVA